MSYLLDTCAISEFVKPTPHPSLVEWLKAQQESELYISAITIGELEKGIVKLDEGKRRRQLEAWLYSDLVRRFRHRILDVTPAIALDWGTRSGGLLKRGITSGMADGLIAATASTHSMVLVTRNTKDFQPLGIPIFNPWEDV